MKMPRIATDGHGQLNPRIDDGSRLEDAAVQAYENGAVATHVFRDRFGPAVEAQQVAELGVDCLDGHAAVAQKVLREAEVAERVHRRLDALHFPPYQADIVVDCELPRRLQVVRLFERVEFSEQRCLFHVLAREPRTFLVRFRFGARFLLLLLFLTLFLPAVLALFLRFAIGRRGRG